MDDKHIRKLQLGRKRRYLKDCIRVHELLDKYETTSSIRKRIFHEHIRPVVRISYAQFNNILNEPNPARQLEEIEKELQALKS